jgi:hypothetical protein
LNIEGGVHLEERQARVIDDILDRLLGVVHLLLTLLGEPDDAVRGHHVLVRRGHGLAPCAVLVECDRQVGRCDDMSVALGQHHLDRHRHRATVGAAGRGYGGVSVVNEVARVVGHSRIGLGLRARVLRIDQDDSVVTPLGAALGHRHGGSEEPDRNGHAEQSDQCSALPRSRVQSHAGLLEGHPTVQYPEVVFD